MKKKNSPDANPKGDHTGACSKDLLRHSRHRAGDRIGVLGANRMDKESPWLNVKEASQYLKIKPRTLSAMARQGNVKDLCPLRYPREKTWRFRREDLDAAMKPVGTK